MLVYCIGHKAPRFHPPVNFTYVSPIGQGIEGEIVIPDDWLGSEFYGDTLSEYAQLFGLADRLKDCRAGESILLFQYRKFLALTNAGTKSANLPYASVCSAAEASQAFPAEASFAEIGDSVLLGPAIKIDSMARNYASYHVADDFAALCISMRDSGEFTLAQCRKFIETDILFPAPSIGIFHVDLYVDHMEKLERVWKHYAANFFTRREGYQRRVGGFLMERLHSFLITQDISLGLFRFVQGHQLIISESTEVQPSL